MHTDDFDYTLPDDLIARYPATQRDGSRLLVSRAGRAPEHRQFVDLPSLLTGDELIVVNDTRVLRARVQGTRHESGGKVELLFVRADGAPRRWIALTRANRPLRPGAVVDLPAGASAEVCSRRTDGAALLDLQGVGDDVPSWLQQHGELPLPPYLKRPAEASDTDRYQTVFAARDGAIAAPTAGLHFTSEIMDALRNLGCQVSRVTLHVGPGTFRPVTVDDPREHLLDPEHYEIPKETAEAVASGRPLLAVGTTVVRTLEHAARAGEGTVQAGPGIADLLLLPGDELRVVDRLLTNFHLPRSSLLMLVCVLAGIRRTLAAYREAVDRQYRFYSYGDATLWL
jgi:S-adenosylmethionine:tRNA ribosyltransferase-isomerase